jgi:hypothetical protein
MTHTVCPHCGSFAIEKICGAREPTNHYGRLVCSDCGRWLAWVPNPEITELINQRNLYIDGLLQYSGISSWEQTFLRSIKGRRWLSDKQQLKFDEISTRLIGKKYENTPSRGSGRGERAIVDSS